MESDLYDEPLDARDPVLPAHVAVAIVGRHAPRASTVTRVDETGGEARTYFIDDEIVLKTQRPHRVRPRTSLEKEALFLSSMQADPSLPTPRFLGYGREHSTEYLCMSRMPGAAVARVALAGAARIVVLRELGRVLRRIHALPQAAFVASGLFPIDASHEALVERLRSSLAPIVSHLETEGERWALSPTPADVAARALEALPRSDERAALHFNPGPVHTFVDVRAGRFQGLIDFADAQISHPVFDLHRWNRVGDRLALWDGYQEDAPVSAACATTWRIAMVLADMTVIARRPDLSSEAERHLQQMLAEI